jgi:hypothetical protein
VKSRIEDADLNAASVEAAMSMARPRALDGVVVVD